MQKRVEKAKIKTAKALLNKKMPVNEISEIPVKNIEKLDVK
jgi:hypothetical protein